MNSDHKKEGKITFFSHDQREANFDNFKLLPTNEPKHVLAIAQWIHLRQVNPSDLIVW